MSDNDHSSERLTIKLTPPNLRETQRRAYWPTVFAEAREFPGEWVRTEKWSHRATAAQVASDSRNSHRRAPEKMRMSGCLPGDRWKTRWQNDPADPDLEHFYVWLRFDETAPTQYVRALDDVAW